MVKTAHHDKRLQGPQYFLMKKVACRSETAVSLFTSVAFSFRFQTYFRGRIDGKYRRSLPFFNTMVIWFLCSVEVSTNSTHVRSIGGSEIYFVLMSGADLYLKYFHLYAVSLTLNSRRAVLFSKLDSYPTFAPPPPLTHVILYAKI